MLATEQGACACPYCKEDIKSDAVKCKHCGSQIILTRPSHDGICPYCKETIRSEANKCKHCKSILIPVTQSTPYEPNAMRGVGDAVARITGSLGVKPCLGCTRRQEWLNSHLPFLGSSFREEK